MKEFEEVFLNEYGFYELKDKPTVEERKNVFENEYYQDNLSTSYEKSYSKEQIKNLNNKFRQKELIINKYVKKAKGNMVVLDIGCGEGFFVSYFNERGYKTYGIDYSIYGVKTQNPQIESLVFQGDSSEILRRFIKEEKKFDVINMDSVLDMMINPKETIELCKELLSESGILIVKVANNYSDLQLHLLETEKLQKEYWLDNPGHPFYFNKLGFENFFQKNGYKMVDIYGESFIEFNLFNPLTNYYEKPGVGKDCYNARIQIENYMCEISIDKTLEIQHTFGEMGIGRELVGVFKRK